MVQGKRTMNRLITFLFAPVEWFRQRRRMKKRIEELRKRDPFIYK
jgi:hypothetical protein